MPTIDPIGGDSESTEATDQRGFPRAVDGRVDIGAVEISPAPTLSAPLRANARKGRVTLRGSSTNAVKVEFQILPGAFRPALGVATWTARISRLRKPITRVIVRATSFDRHAAQQTVVVRARN